MSAAEQVRAGEQASRNGARAAGAPSADAAGWYRVGGVEDVPRLEGRSVTLDGRRVALFRLPGGWAATDAACPHAGGPLQDGIVADACVTCPLHGRRFDLESGVQLGGADRVAVHEVEERDGTLWVRPSSRAWTGTHRSDADARSIAKDAA